MAGTPVNSLNISTEGVTYFNAPDFASIPNGTTGQVLTANAIGAPTFQAAPPSALIWEGDNGTSLTGVAGHGYFCTRTLTITLPSAPAIGSTIGIIHYPLSAGVITIKASGSDIIQIGVTQTIAAGVITSNAYGDSITLVYLNGLFIWFAFNAPQGNWLLT